jgi:hypothetical protein
MLPASNDPTYLAQTSAAVYARARRLRQQRHLAHAGLALRQRPRLLVAAAIQAYLAGAPDNGTLILDLWSEAVPVWSKTQSYYGKPFIWCMLHNFGGNRDLYGNLDVLAQQPIAARAAAGSTMVGTGLTPEAIEQNPVVYELMTDMGWLAAAPNVGTWLAAYATQRYGAAITPGMLQAWQLLLVGAYSNVYMTDSAITHVPDLSMPTHSQSLQNFTLIANAWRLMHADLLRCPPPLPGPLLYDALDLLRQVLCNLFEDARHIHAAAYKEYMLANSTRSSQDVLHSLRGLGALITALISTSTRCSRPIRTFCSARGRRRRAPGPAAPPRRRSCSSTRSTRSRCGAIRARSTTTPPSSGRRSSPTTTTSAGHVRRRHRATPWRRACRSTPPRLTTPCSIATCSGTTRTTTPSIRPPPRATSSRVSATLHGALRADARRHAVLGARAHHRGRRRSACTACTTLTRDVPSLAYLCLADPLCGGFTTEGFLIVRGAQTTTVGQRRDDLRSQLIETKVV